MALREDAPNRYPAEALDLERLAPEILDRILDGCYAVDHDWRLVRANLRACEGWGASREAIVGRVLWQCFPQLTGTAAERQLRNAVEAGVASEFETFCPVVRCWLWVWVDPIRPGMTAIYWRDITERKRADETLRESEARFRQAFEQSPLGKATAGPDFRFREVNPALCTMLGYTADELTGTSFLDIVHPADRDTCRRHGTALATGEIEHFQLEERFLRKSGETIWVAVNVGPIRDAEGRILYTLGIIEDIDERKRIEAEMRRLTDELEARVEIRTRELVEANDRLRRERLLSELIVENTTEGIIVLDADMRHLLWNGGMEIISGLTRSEVLGKTVFDVFPHLLDHPVGQAWRDALAGRRTELRGRRYFSPARGVEVVYDADHAPLYDPRRSIIGAVSIVRETTERHRMEEMLRQSQKMEAVAQLTGGVAHDFNNLLTAVVGCLDMIASQVKDKRLRRLAETALRSANRGARLTHQLLSFARQQELKSVVTDLNDVLGGMEMLLRAAGDNIEMVVDGALDLWLSVIDPAQFETAVMNFVMNAHASMPKGGRLVLSTRNIEARNIPAGVELRVGDYVALSVHDTGEGMSPNVKARAFEPFYTTREIGRGPGLGLSMVYGFAKQSGGGVLLNSQPGAGTCVTIYLPRAQLPEGSTDAAARLEPPHEDPGTILVVDDDAEVREMTIAMLHSLGYRASIAGDGLEALAALRRDDRIDLLFTDLVMPFGMSGIDLARRARAMRPGLKVLLTTGYAGSGAPATSEFRLLPKPFRPHELGRALAEMMRGPNRD